MTKRLFSTFAFALVASLPFAFASSLEAQVGRLQGGGVIYNFNTICQNDGWTQSSEQVLVRYHPFGLGNNGPRESISFHASNWSLSYLRLGGPFGTELTDVIAGGSFSRPFFIEPGAPNSGRIRILIHNPATVTPTLRTPVRIRGQIRNLGGTRNCNALFEATVAQRL